MADERPGFVSEDGSTMSREAFEHLIAGDLTWLALQPRSLERDHIEAVLRDAVASYYPENRGNVLRCWKHGGKGFASDCVACQEPR